MEPGRIRDPEQLSRLLDAVLLIESNVSLPVALRGIVEAACELVHARYGALGVLNPLGEGLSDFITWGIDDDTIADIGELPQGRGILGLLIREPATLRLSDISSHPQSVGFPPGHPTMTSFLGVPIRVREAVFGMLYLADKTGPATVFTEEDEDLVAALARAAGIAIDNARLHARLSDLAVVEDRERIARDLHDTVIQRLFATGLALQAMVRAAEPEQSRRLVSAIEDLDDTIRQIRTTIFALAGGDAVAGVRDALVDLVAEMTPALGFAPSIKFVGPVETVVTAELAEHLIKTLREALTNIARHAKAISAQVSVMTSEDRLTLRVVDDGVGISNGGSLEGRGLLNLEQRATSLGGFFQAVRGPGGGTIVTWEVPIRC